VDAWRKKCTQGDVVVVRYADDNVLGFQYRADADRFLDEFRERLGKFGLELHPDKTRRIEFGRFAEQSGKREEKGSPKRSIFWDSRISAGKTGTGTLR
jgi:RNA-directed DNA polymerase